MECEEAEAKMAQQDRLIKETDDARNDLETYVYNMRDAVNSTLTEYVGDEEKESFLALLSAEESWLYTDEGYDGDKKTFVRRLSTLQETGATFETRKKEHLARDGEVAKTKTTIMKYVKSFVVHVGGTRCVTSSTANIMKIRARITWTVECIRTCVCLFLCYV